MNLFVFLFIVFSSQIIQFERYDLSINRVMGKYPVKSHPELVWVLTAPPTQCNLRVWLAKGVSEAVVRFAIAETVGRVEIRHIFSANV